MSENTRKTRNKKKEVSKALIRQCFDECVKRYGKVLEELAKK